MNKRVQEIINETLAIVYSDLMAENLKMITEYEEEANKKLPAELQEKIHFRIGMLKGQLAMGYQEINKVT
jgi:hypothetical protein